MRTAAVAKALPRSERSKAPHMDTCGALSFNRVSVELDLALQQEGDNQRVNNQGLNQGEPEDHWRENLSRGIRITRNTLQRRGGSQPLYRRNESPKSGFSKKFAARSKPLPVFFARRGGELQQSRTISNSNNLQQSPIIST